MIYTDMTVRALQLAWNAHMGQVDKCGMPYILHPYHLAEQMDDEISCTAALLHDVVEDTSVTLAQLRNDFPDAVVDAVALLTHDAGTDYFEYVARIKSNPIALKVKLADLRHNADPSRLAICAVTPEKKRALERKYARAMDILSE